MKKTLNIIKTGGNVLDDPAALDAFLRDFACIPEAKILVHGGGKIASTLGARLGLQPQYVQGRRVTDDATLELVTMVYGGLINRRLCARLQALGCNALGLTGADGNVLRASKRSAAEVDFGWAGDTAPGLVNAGLLHQWLEQGLTPVLAPLTHDGLGQLLNTNADTIASVVAQAMTGCYAVRLMFCFEKKGILANPDDEETVIPILSREQYRQMQVNASARDGILPKLDSAFAALAAGVPSVIAGSAADILLNLNPETICGTIIAL